MTGEGTFGVIPLANDANHTDDEYNLLLSGWLFLFAVLLSAALLFTMVFYVSRLYHLLISNSEADETMNKLSNRS